jgi:hypothetical protein
MYIKKVKVLYPINKLLLDQVIYIVLLAVNKEHI